MKKIKLLTVCVLMLVVYVSCSNNGTKNETTITNSQEETTLNEESKSSKQKNENSPIENGEINIFYEYEANEKKDFIYHINDNGNVVIDNYIGNSTLVVIPDAIDGKTVTEIGKFEKNDYVTNMQIGTTIEKIADNAFQDWSKLKQVIIASGEKNIGKAIFKNCSNLKLAVIAGENVLGEGIFSNCEKLEEVRIEGNLKVLPKDTFSGCSSLKNVDLTIELEEIDEGCFNGCNSIRRIYLSKNVNSIKSFPKNATMIAYKDSYAYQYAKDNGVQIELNDGDLY